MIKVCTERLLNLIKAYPDLPIIPMVDGEIAEDECHYWRGTFGGSFVDKYLETAGGVHFYSEGMYKDDEDRELSDLNEIEATLIGYHKRDLHIPDNKLIEQYNQLPWKEAIIVYITLPREED